MIISFIVSAEPSLVPGNMADTSFLLKNVNGSVKLYDMIRMSHRVNEISLHSVWLAEVTFNHSSLFPFLICFEKGKNWKGDNTAKKVEKESKKFFMKDDTQVAEKCLISLVIRKYKLTPQCNTAPTHQNG